MPTVATNQQLISWTPAGTDLRAWIDGLGAKFATFDLQDSGCVSYGIEAGSIWLFVKTSTTDAAASSIRRALRFHSAVRHPAIVAPLAAHRFPDDRVALVYPWREGRVLYPTTTLGSAIRTDPTGPMVAFRARPVTQILAALDTILHAHVTISAAGFVAVDLYDGCFLYDDERLAMHLVDLDEYRPGPFTVAADRLPGSSRFMAPEEHRRGAVIDERTTVHALGRTLRLLLDAGDAEQDWRGTDDQLAVICRATDPDPAHRHTTVIELLDAWRSATGPVGVAGEANSTPEGAATG